MGFLCKQLIQTRTAQTSAALTRLKPVWSNRSISISSKIRLVRSFVTSIFLYACQSWTLTAELQRRVRAMEMSCCHCKDHVTDEEVCQDPASNLTTQRPPDHRKKMQTAVVCSCLPFIRSSQNHLARHSKRGKKTRQAEKEMGKRYQGMDRPGVRKSH